jgi:tetratricopeptide (TPR) repeat protein
MRATGSALHVRLGIACLAVLVLAALGAFLVIRNSDFLTTRAKTVIDKDVRLDFWRAAAKQWQIGPVLGTGSRTYLYYARRFREPYVQMDPVYTHNDYLQLLAEYGVAGFLAFLIFLGAHLRNGLISARRLGPRRISATQRVRGNRMALNVGALAAVAAYAVHSFFDFNLHIPANLLLLAFVFGILADSTAPEERPVPDRGWPIFAAASLAGLSLLLAVQICRLAPGEWYAERARTALRDQRPLAAMAMALKGVSAEKGNPQLYYYLGRAYYLSGERQSTAAASASFYQAAIPAYEEAQRLAPMDDSYPLELAFTLDSLSRFAEAEWLFYDARKLDPKSNAVRRYYEAHLQRWSGLKLPTTEEPVAPEPPA